MFRKNRKLSIEEMLESEDWIDQVWDSAMAGCSSASDLADKLLLSVEYVPSSELGDDIEAVLSPTTAKKHNGAIKISSAYKNKSFSFVHELIHYLMDVGIGNQVDKVFARKKKGRDKSHHEQVVDFRTAAASMRYQEIKKDIIRYDKSKPKLDELRFVDELCKKYSQEPDSVLKRIREVRREYYAKKEKITT